jgi:hypothetical protein
MEKTKNIGIVEDKKISIKEQEQKIRELLQKHVHRTINREHEAFVDFLEIMMAQDQWLDKLDTIQAFRVTRSKLNKALILQVMVNNFARWLTVSWRKGSSQKRKEENPLQSSFRQSIHRQILLWKKINSFGAECVECKNVRIGTLRHDLYKKEKPFDVQHLKLQADHKDPSFLKLTKDFLERQINKDVPTEFDYHHKCGRKFKKKDNRFKQRWQTYHQQHAVLQWLCRKCNLSKKKK